MLSQGIRHCPFTARHFSRSNISGLQYRPNVWIHRWRRANPAKARSRSNTPLPNLNAILHSSTRRSSLATVRLVRPAALSTVQATARGFRSGAPVGTRHSSVFIPHAPMPSHGWLMKDLRNPQPPQTTPLKLQGGCLIPFGCSRHAVPDTVSGRCVPRDRSVRLPENLAVMPSTPRPRLSDTLKFSHSVAHTRSSSFDAQ